MSLTEENNILQSMTQKVAMKTELSHANASKN